MATSVQTVISHLQSGGVCSNPCRTSKGKEYESATNWLQCLKLPIRDIDPSDVRAYAQRAGPTDLKFPGDQLCAIMTSLLYGRILYYKNTFGDCPQKSNISLGLPGTLTKYGGLGVTGVGAASAISLASTGGAGIGASAAGSGAALGGLPAVVGTAATVVGLALIPLAIWGVISAHHKIAVAREQATICDFAQAYNEWEDAIEIGLQNGYTTVVDAKNAVPQMEAQLIAGLQAIRQECNAACYMQKSLRALNLYAVEKLYDKLGARSASSTSSLPGSSKISTGGRLGIATIAGVGVAALA